MAVQKREHYEERIAHANGAEIEFLITLDNKPFLWESIVGDPLWIRNYIYRVKPDCEYAIEEIRKLGGDEAVKYYLYWLDGGEVYVECGTGNEVKLCFDKDHPFELFLEVIKDNEIVKKKRTVKQVLWEYNDNDLLIKSWANINVTSVCVGGHYLNKTDLTREIEVD